MNIPNLRFHLVLSPKHALALFFSLASFCAQAQWTNIDGLPGGSVRELRKGVNNLFVGSPHGVFRSTDQGENFERLPPFSSNAAVVADGPNILIAAETGLPYPNHRRAYQSSDDGFSWQAISEAAQDTISAPDAIWGEYAYAKSYGTPLKTFRTKDRGETWEWVANEHFSFIPDGGWLYRSKGSALLRSSDGGFSWDTLSNFPFNIALKYKKGDDIIIVSSWVPQAENILVSRDGGLSWKTIALPALDFGSYSHALFHQDKVYVFRVFEKKMAVADEDFTVVASIDLPEDDRIFSAFSLGNRLLVSTLSSGLIWYDNDDEWRKHLTFNYSGGRMKTCDGRVWATSGRGLHRLTTDKLHWESMARDFDLRRVVDFVVDGNHITLAGGRVWASSDGGLTFAAGKKEDGSVLEGGYFLAKSGERLFSWDYGSVGVVGLHYSDDHGLLWKPLPLSPSGLFLQKMNEYEGQVYAFDSLAMLYRWNGNQLAFDPISTTPIPFVNPHPVFPPNAIFVHGDTYIVGEHGIGAPVADHYFVSTDAGQSWAQQSPRLSSVAFSGDTIFAARTDFPMVFSTDKADTWQPFSEGMDGNAMSLSLLEGEILASTNQAIYRRKTNGMLVQSIDFEQDTIFQVVPNPFTDHFFVRFSDPTQVSVIGLYDVLGRPIRLTYGPFGSSEIQISPVGYLPCGVYFLHLESARKRSVLKLVNCGE